MTLIQSKTTFINDLIELWDNSTQDTTIYETGDLIQKYWENSRVTGFLADSPITIPNATYPGLSPIMVIPGTAATAAASVELACSNLVLTTLFILTPPAISTPPPIPAPGGAAIPGVLTATLTTFFLALSSSSKAAAFANIISLYLQSWTINVTIPPASPTPIIIL